jgi:hypothetical protein
MRKLIVLLAAAIAAVAEVKGAAANPVEKLPYEAYFTDIKFDAKTNELRFNDTYKKDKAVDRQYVIEFYYRTNDTNLMYVCAGGCHCFYTYGITDGYAYQATTIYDAETGKKIEQQFNAPHSKGELRVFNISEGIAACLKAGEGRLLIAIKGVDYVHRHLP